MRQRSRSAAAYLRRAAGGFTAPGDAPGRGIYRGVACALALILACVAARAQNGADPARGEAKAAACAACHGRGAQPPQPGTPLLDGQQAEFLVLQMFYMREGLREVPQMAGMLKGFSDRDLEDVAAYYSRNKAASPAEAVDVSLRARGQSLAQSMGCASCHMVDYRGQRHVPAVAGQREDYLIAALKAYRDNKRSGSDTSMNAAMYQVTDADIAALAHYLAHRR